MAIYSDGITWKHVPDKFDWKRRILGFVFNASAVLLILVTFEFYQNRPDEVEVIERMKEVELFRAEKQLRHALNNGDATCKDIHRLLGIRAALRAIADAKDGEPDNVLTNYSNFITITNASSQTQYVRFPISPYLKQP